MTPNGGNNNNNVQQQQIQSDVLRVYVDAVEKAKADCEKYVRLAKLGQAQIEETNVNVDDMERKINARSVMHANVDL